MYTLFMVCFGVGVGYIFIGFILGEIAGHISLDGDIDVDFDGSVSPLKPAVIASFLTVFGGVGLIALNRVGEFQALSIALVLGFAVAFVIFRFVITPLYRAQNTSSFEIQSLIGHAANVTEAIPQGGYGKIIYYMNGNTLSAPAKAQDGNGISVNEKVEIVHIEKNTYYVTKI